MNGGGSSSIESDATIVFAARSSSMTRSRASRAKLYGLLPFNRFPEYSTCERANSGDLNSNESKALELQLIYHILKPTDYHGESATDVQPGRRAPGSAHSSRSLPGVPGSYAVGKRVSMDLYTCSGTARRPVLVVWTMSSVTSELRWCLNSIFLPSTKRLSRTSRLKMSSVLWERPM